MKTTYKILALFTLALLIFSCSSDSDNVIVPNSPEPEDRIQSNAFIEELIRLGRQQSINRNIINWYEGRNRVYEAFDKEGKRAAIFEFLSVLDDNHSFYESRNSFIYAGSSCREGGSAYQFDLPPEIAYVQVNSTGMSIEFAEAVHREIARQNKIEIKAWVVDLSQNGGGSMYPMLAGLSPLLDEGVIGYFIDPDNEQLSWEQNRGVISLMGNTAIAMSHDIELINPEAKIAVVWGRNTASSGEATLIAFLGSDRVRTFGEPSCGLSTANQAFTLSDGGTMHLTVSTMADRNKTLYGGMVTPDVEVSNSEELNQAIIDWVME